jgi:hypothetical protein
MGNRDPRLPLSIGGPEAQLRKVKLMVKPRAPMLRNQERTQRLLDLITLHLRGADQVDAYANHIRAHVEANQGAAPAQRDCITGTAHALRSLGMQGRRRARTAADPDVHVSLAG